MRTSFFVAVILSFVCPAAVHAQSAENATERKTHASEIGIFGQTDFSQEHTNMAIAGVQFKKWMNEYIGFRVLGGYASYGAQQAPFFIGGVQGAAEERHINHHISLGILGAGIEAQRQFYKRIYLFAGLELKGGYGSGTADTVIKTTHRYQGHHEATWDANNGSAPASLAYLDFMPSIGAKLQFSKLVFGIEVSGVLMNYTSITTGGITNAGVMNFGAGGYIVHRGFINYRF